MPARMMIVIVLASSSVVGFILLGFILLMRIVMWIASRYKAVKPESINESKRGSNSKRGGMPSSLRLRLYPEKRNRPLPCGSSCTVVTATPLNPRVCWGKKETCACFVFLEYTVTLFGGVPATARR
jgi:hypothetical protein